MILVGLSAVIHAILATATLAPDLKEDLKVALSWGHQARRSTPHYTRLLAERADHLAQLGWSCYKRGEYARAAEYYEQVFSSRDDHPDYYYICAAGAWGALGNSQMTLKYLQLAAENGWAAYEYTTGEELFEGLHGTPEWEAVLVRIQQNAD